MRLTLVSLALATAAATASAQTGSSPASHIQAGDRAYAARDSRGALTEYQAAIAADPKSVDALWKASAVAAQMGQFSDSTRDSMYSLAKRYAHDAVEIAPRNANAQFAMAQVLGLQALTKSDPQERLPYAQETYHHLLTCLKIDPKSAGCAHVLGLWNADVMRTDPGLRSMAINMLGADELSQGSWENAVRYLQQAIHAEPNRITHHFDLAQTYLSMGDTAKAKAEFQTVLQAPVTDFNDPHYKEEAKGALAHL